MSPQTTSPEPEAGAKKPRYTLEPLGPPPTGKSTLPQLPYIPAGRPRPDKVFLISEQPQRESAYRPYADEVEFVRLTRQLDFETALQTTLQKSPPGTLVVFENSRPTDRPLCAAIDREGDRVFLGRPEARTLRALRDAGFVVSYVGGRLPGASSVVWALRDNLSEDVGARREEVFGSSADVEAAAQAATAPEPVTLTVG